MESIPEFTLIGYSPYPEHRTVVHEAVEHLGYARWPCGDPEDLFTPTSNQRRDVFVRMLDLHDRKTWVSRSCYMLRKKHCRKASASLFGPSLEKFAPIDIPHLVGKPIEFGGYFWVLYEPKEKAHTEVQA